jgi:hypothetical protein
MALSETYQCDVCGAKKSETDHWWLAWHDCLPDSEAGHPLLKLTAWHLEGAHSPGVIHLCGARCAGTLMDRWMAEQHENPDAQCVP